MPSRMFPRPLSDLALALRQHIDLLRFDAHHAFQEHNELFLGEIAAKLRLLVAEQGRRRRPLLLDLMDALAADIQFRLNLPPVRDPDAGRDVTLRHYMGRTALGIRTEGGFRMLTHAEFVRERAQQYGSSHEAWEVTEHFLNARHAGVFISGES